MIYPGLVCDVEAPSSMKSVVLAGWLLTTACGNLIDVIVTATRVISQVTTVATSHLIALYTLSHCHVDSVHVNND